MGGDEWTKFFRDAGIAPHLAAVYATTFTKHRIQVNMLLDLNRDNFKELGVNAIGDTILMVRHAKSFDEQAIRETSLACSLQDSQVQKFANSGRRSPPQLEIASVAPIFKEKDCYARNQFLPVEYLPGSAANSMNSETTLRQEADMSRHTMTHDHDEQNIDSSLLHNRQENAKNRIEPLLSFSSTGSSSQSNGNYSLAPNKSVMQQAFQMHNDASKEVSLHHMHTSTTNSMGTNAIYKPKEKIWLSQPSLVPDTIKSQQPTSQRDVSQLVKTSNIDFKHDSHSAVMSSESGRHMIERLVGNPVEPDGPPPESLSVGPTTQTVVTESLPNVELNSQALENESVLQNKFQNLPVASSSILKVPPATRVIVAKTKSAKKSRAPLNRNQVRVREPLVHKSSQLSRRNIKALPGCVTKTKRTLLQPSISKKPYSNISAEDDSCDFNFMIKANIPTKRGTASESTSFPGSSSQTLNTVAFDKSDDDELVSSHSSGLENDVIAENVNVSHVGKSKLPGSVFSRLGDKTQIVSPRNPVVGERLESDVSGDIIMAGKKKYRIVKKKTVPKKVNCIQSRKVAIKQIQDGKTVTSFLKSKSAVVSGLGGYNDDTTLNNGNPFVQIGGRLQLGKKRPKGEEISYPKMSASRLLQSGGSDSFDHELEYSSYEEIDASAQQNDYIQNGNFFNSDSLEDFQEDGEISPMNSKAVHFGSVSVTEFSPDSPPNSRAVRATGKKMSDIFGRLGRNQTQ